MIPQNRITVILNGIVEELVGRSSFFREWTPGLVDPAASQRFLVSFDSLVKTFPTLIAAGAARMEDETSRTVLAINLYQECGEGDVTRTHHAIYRKFLSTAGIDVSAIQENGFAAEWRRRLSEYVHQVENVGAVIGALAAGEFLAQPALSRIYPLLKAQYPGADQEYFTKHLDLETEHVEEITKLIVQQAEKDGGWEKVLTGFKFGLSVWEEYFNRLARYLAEQQPSTGRR